MVRGKKAGNAKAVLNFCLKKGALPMKKLLDSAVANATNNFKLEEKDLFISLLKVDEGRTLKRWRARARGRACRIEKKTSNITMALDIERKTVLQEEKVQEKIESKKKPITVSQKLDIKKKSAKISKAKKIK